MRHIGFAAVLALLSYTARAATDQDAKQAALTKAIVTATKMPTAMWTSSVRPMLQNVWYYRTAVELLAATPDEGTIGYALDTNRMYLYTTSWASLSSSAMANGETITNSVDRTFEFNDVTETMTLTFGTNLGTFASTTGATFAFTPAVAFTDDVTLSGGASAVIFSDGASSIVLPDNDATAMIMGSTDQLNLLTFDTGNDAETVVVTGTTATTALHVDVGESLFDEGVDMAIAATALEVIRFCGNGSATGIAHYMGPVLPGLDIIDTTGGAQDPVDTSFGTAFCDGLDNATEATADRVWHTSWAIRPVAMSCVGRCTGASAANDAITYQLRDDTASVTGMACTASAWTGDDVPKQCTVRDASPATIAANSAIAVMFTGTDDACDAGGDDFECFVYFTY